MKKIIQVIAIVIVSALMFDLASAGDKVIIKYGLDTNGFQNYPSTFSTTTFPSLGPASMNIDLGNSILLEFQHQGSEFFGMGLGATFNFNRTIHDTNAQFSFLPVYITASLYPLGNIVGVAPYAKADAGWNVSFTGNDSYKAPAPFTTDLTGGFYWAAGAGVKFANTIFVDIMYTSYAGAYKVGLGPLSGTVDVLYTKVSLNAGIGFDM